MQNQRLFDAQIDNGANFGVQLPQGTTAVSLGFGQRPSAFAESQGQIAGATKSSTIQSLKNQSY